MQLPPALTTALAHLLEGVSRNDLAKATEQISAAYRGGKGSDAILTEFQAIAYAVARMPATYAASRAVFARLSEVLPDFAPASLLDVGAGTGAASWAAATAWPDIGAITMLDRNPTLRSLAGRLAPAACRQILAGDLGTAKPQADLVVASYVLAELPEEKIGAAVVDLCQAAAGVLALVEPGTPAGFARIRAARRALIEAGAHVAAPCTHNGDCPVRNPDWCHFSQRLARSRDHKLLKEADVPFEDERYSYLVVTRMPVARRAAARILAPPLQTKPGLTFKLCDEIGS